MNGEPIYDLSGEREADDDDLREAMDMIVPGQNLHTHLESDNGLDKSFQEPLDSDYEDVPMNLGKSYTSTYVNKTFFLSEILCTVPYLANQKQGILNVM